jgi:hypothetical protein
MNPEAVIDRRMVAAFPIKEWKIGSQQVTDEAGYISDGEMGSEDWRKLIHHDKNQTQ